MANTDATGVSFSDQTQIRFLYLGAFAALGIPNSEAARELAAVTASTIEAFQAIVRLKDSPPGDRVWPVLEWLRARRAARA